MDRYVIWFFKMWSEAEELMEQEEEDDDMLSVTCSARNDANNKLNADKSGNFKPILPRLFIIFFISLKN